MLPYDVWELIGNYILPESIASFSRICKDSYAVINKPSFWVRIHKEFCFSEPANMGISTRGLKQKVVRYLFLKYLPLSSRLNTPQAKIYDPHVLVGLMCLKHEWKIVECEELLANRRVRYDITFSKMKASSSLWESEQVSLYN